MRLYFFRHAQAGQGKDNDPQDELRELTQEGINQTHSASHVLETLNVKPTQVYTSPLIRSKQTADIIAGALDLKVEVKDELRPGFRVESIEKLTRFLPDRADVMFFGHEPDFSIAISRIIGGGEINLRKGGLARIDVVSREPLRGTLVWLLAPRIFDSLCNDEDED